MLQSDTFQPCRFHSMCCIYPFYCVQCVLYLPLLQCPMCAVSTEPLLLCSACAVSTPPTVCSVCCTYHSYSVLCVLYLLNLFFCAQCVLYLPLLLCAVCAVPTTPTVSYVCCMYLLDSSFMRSVCCIYPSYCGYETNREITYFKNPDYPSSISNTDLCHYRVKRVTMSN